MCTSHGRSDRDYFRGLRHLLEGPGCDLALLCRGKLVDERGYKQEVLTQVVRAHSVLAVRRCRWLGRLIDVAREERDRRRAMAVPEGDGSAGGGGVAAGAGRPSLLDLVGDSPPDGGAVRIRGSDGGDYDDGIRALPNFIPDQIGVRGRDRDAAACSLAAEVEDYDDDDEIARRVSGEGAFIPQDTSDGGRSGSPIISSSSISSSNMLYIDIDHPPEAVKLVSLFVFSVPNEKLLFTRKFMVYLAYSSFFYIKTPMSILF